MQTLRKRKNPERDPDFHKGVSSKFQAFRDVHLQQTETGVRVGEPHSTMATQRILSFQHLRTVSLKGDGELGDVGLFP